MKEVLKRRKKNNKGFSLVELIVVIAIMAVLIGLLAPQFIKYLEKSKISKDKTTVSQVETAINVALANEEVYDEVSSGADIVITFSGTKLTAVGGTKLNAEVVKTIDLNKTAMQSKTFKTAATNPTITISKTDMTVTVDYKGQ